MKKVVWLFLIPFIISCQQIDELKTFTINHDVEFTIPATNPGLIDIPTTSVESNTEQQFKNNDADINHVEKITLSALKLTITNPQSEDFSFLNSIHIYMKAPGLEKVKIAYKDDVPENVSSFDMETTGAILDEYLKQDSYTLIYQTETDELTSQDITIRADMAFQVRAKIM